ncbi:MAG: imidazoleglycerol-phosphate dehydratase HisB [Candidatus Omnitrophica bacterium]|nr:imidazoleglycerol-phosphate dehydratase HisB [Candidatus Omnitrophota bacterium]
MRRVKIRRKTEETEVKVELNIDGEGKYKISTGIPFLDHMLSLLAKHGLFDLKLKAKGDLEIDPHHTNEDVGITLGQAFALALKDKNNLKRFGWGFVVLDEAEVRVVLDLSGRPYLEVNPKNIKGCLENYSFRYFKEFLRAFINNSLITLHVDILKGEDLHHILECSFKALGLALDQATSLDRRKKGLPTTKGKI